MSICAHTVLYIYIYIFIHTHTHVYIYICIYIHIHCMYTHTYLPNSLAGYPQYVSVQTPVQTCTLPHIKDLHTCILTYIITPTHTCIHAYIHTHTHTRADRQRDRDRETETGSSGEPCVHSSLPASPGRPPYLPTYLSPCLPAYLPTYRNTDIHTGAHIHIHTHTTCDEPSSTCPKRHLHAGTQMCLHHKLQGIPMSLMVEPRRNHIQLPTRGRAGT